MDEAPVMVRTQPRNVDASAYHVAGKDATGFDIVFASAPSGGTTPVIDWQAYGEAAYLHRQ